MESLKIENQWGKKRTSLVRWSWWHTWIEKIIWSAFTIPYFHGTLRTRESWRILNLHSLGLLLVIMLVILFWKRYIYRAKKIEQVSILMASGIKIIHINKRKYKYEIQENVKISVWTHDSFFFLKRYVFPSFVLAEKKWQPSRNEGT